MPRLDTRPVMDTAADAGLFVDRKEDLDRLERALRSDLNTVIFGERGVGKTSLLRHAAYRLREKGEPVVIIDAGLVASLEDLLATIREAIGNAPHLGELLSEGLRRTVHPPTSTYTAISAVRSLDVGQRLILMVDNLSDSGIREALFGRLRDELWRLPHTWAVTADDAERTQLLAPPADAFFAVQITLRPLDPRAATELLVRRECELAIADLVGRSAPGNPRALLEIARQAVMEGVSASSVLQEQAELEAAVSRLGRPASMAWYELKELGAAAASDEDFLQRLGWTRARATQVLRELEAARLVTARDEPTGRGRPRRVYVPVTSLSAGTGDGS